MISHQLQKGFTLIEIMMVVAIISILATVIFPTYKEYGAKAKDSACLSEAKNYSNKVFYELNDQDDSTSPVGLILSACESITDATGWTLSTQKKIVAIAKSPSNVRIECDIPNGSPCRVVP